MLDFGVFVPTSWSFGKWMNNDRIVLHSDPAKNYKASDSDMNGGRQLVIGYLLIKLCKELGVPFDCFIQVVTRL